MGALDAINGRFGTWTAVTASQGFKREWKMWSESALACVDDQHRSGADGSGLGRKPDQGIDLE
jgi:hypothetical protein